LSFRRRGSEWWRTSESLLARWLRAAQQALLGEMPILAAGTALFAIIAAVPALAAVVSVYGVVADPSEIRTHLSGLQTVLPTEVVSFLTDQLERQAKRSNGVLGFQITTSILFSLFSARASAKALIDSLNRAYRVREQRGVFVKLALTLAIAAGTLVGLMVLLSVVVALPGVVAAIDLKRVDLVRWIRWPVLLAIVFGALCALYRFAPTPRPLGTERHTWPGAAVATLLLIVVSWGLSQWVERVADYEVFYGAFGSVLVVVLWFYLSTMAIIIGGFINAELERHAGAPAPDRSMY
jgi:membrane protein